MEPLPALVTLASIRGILTWDEINFQGTDAKRAQAP